MVIIHAVHIYKIQSNFKNNSLSKRKVRYNPKLQNNMKISIIILFLSFFTIHFDLTQSFTIHLSKVGTVPDFDITKVWIFNIERNRNSHYLIKKKTIFHLQFMGFLFIIITIFSIICNLHILKDLKSGWKEACASTSTEPVEIYFSGTYTLKPVELKGPCKGPVKIIMDGTVRALVKQKDVGGDHWIKISHVNDLTIGGYAILDGQGKSAWKHNECSKNSNCKLSMVSKILFQNSNKM